MGFDYRLDIESEGEEARNNYYVSSLVCQRDAMLPAVSSLSRSLWHSSLHTQGSSWDTCSSVFFSLNAGRSMFVSVLRETWKYQKFTASRNSSQPKSNKELEGKNPSVFIPGFG